MLRVVINGTEYRVEENSLLRDCLLQAAVAMPCGGQGVCGKCKVTAHGEVSALTEAEARFLTQEEIKAGVRLACFTRVTGDCAVEVIPFSASNVCVTTNVPPRLDVSTFRYGFAVDVGTTTVAAVLYDGAGQCLAVASAANPQIVFGSDVLSRAMAAQAGERETLAAAIRSCITALLERLATCAEIQTTDIHVGVITGNTVMLCLLTETAVDTVIKAPFSSRRLFGEVLTAKECGIGGLSPNVTIYLPRCLDAFLGADFVCSMASVALCEQTETALLVDVGTNGEMALWHQGDLFACSTASGSAFEGIGVSCGMVAAQGAIDRVEIANQRLVPHIIGGGVARGICGSGLVDSLARLLDLEEMDACGAVAKGGYPLTDDVRLTQEDIHALSVSKSAIRSGMETLCHTASIGVSDVKKVYLAGGFGNSLRVHNAMRIGLLPREWEGKTSLVGNAALDGAARLLFQPDLDRLPRFHKVDLANNAYFADAFMRNMLF